MDTAMNNPSKMVDFKRLVLYTKWVRMARFVLMQEKE
jgi:hypothetical protein